MIAVIRTSGILRVIYHCKQRHSVVWLIPILWYALISKCTDCWYDVPRDHHIPSVNHPNGTFALHKMKPHATLSCKWKWIVINMNNKLDESMQNALDEFEIIFKFVRCSVVLTCECTVKQRKKTLWRWHRWWILIVMLPQPSAPTKLEINHP